MRLFLFFTTCILFFSSPAFAQKIIRHQIKSGESIYGLAKKYEVTESEIYELNPKLKGAVLALNAEVKIPNKKSKPDTKAAKNTEVADNRKSKSAKIQPAPSAEMLPTHLVLPKETLYGISKKYNVTIESIEQLNPEIKEGGLKIGMVLQLASGFEEKAFVSPVETTPEVPAVAVIKPEEKPLAKKAAKEKKSKVKEVENKETAQQPVTENAKPAVAAEIPKPALPLPEGSLTHKVQPKETLFRISKKYNTSVAELQKLNPDMASGLPVGYELVIRKGEDKTLETKTIKDSGTVAETASDVVSVSPMTVENLSKAEFLIAKASENLGARYRSGGTSPGGFDCSGLMFSTFKNIDMTLPRSSHEMARYGQRIDRSQAQKGDLIFFATFGRGRVSHVGMVTEVSDDEIKFIHSSTQSGVIISSTKESYYARTFVQVNRVLAQ